MKQEKNGQNWFNFNIHSFCCIILMIFFSNTYFNVATLINSNLNWLTNFMATWWLTLFFWTLLQKNNNSGTNNAQKYATLSILFKSILECLVDVACATVNVNMKLLYKHIFCHNVICKYEKMVQILFWKLCLQLDFHECFCATSIFLLKITLLKEQYSE